MIPMPSGVRVWIAAGHTDMRRGMQGAGASGPGAVEARPPWRRSLPFPGAQGRPREDPLARRPRAVALRQAARTGKVHLAVGEGGRRVDFGGADGPHAGRDRLAESAADVAAQKRWVSAPASAGQAKKNMGHTHFRAPRIAKTMI